MAAALSALFFMVRQRAPRGFVVSLACIGPMAVMILELLLAVALVMYLATRDPTERIERFLYPAGIPAQD